MAYSINSVVGRFSGEVSFSDNTSLGFHAGLSDDMAYSADKDSVNALDALNYNSELAGSGPTADGTIISAPFIHGFLASTIANPANNKKVTDFYAQLSLTITFDNNKTQVFCATTSRISGVLTTIDNTLHETDWINGAANAASLATILNTMFAQAFSPTGLVSSVSVTIG